MSHLIILYSPSLILLHLNYKLSWFLLCPMLLIRYIISLWPFSLPFVLASIPCFSCTWSTWSETVKLLLVLGGERLQFMTQNNSSYFCPLWHVHNNLNLHLSIIAGTCCKLVLISLTQSKRVGDSLYPYSPTKAAVFNNIVATERNPLHRVVTHPYVASVCVCPCACVCMRVNKHIYLD